MPGSQRRMMAMWCDEAMCVLQWWDVYQASVPCTQPQVSPHVTYTHILVLSTCYGWKEYLFEILQDIDQVACNDVETPIEIEVVVVGSPETLGFERTSTQNCSVISQGVPNSGSRGCRTWRAREARRNNFWLCIYIYIYLFNFIYLLDIYLLRRRLRMLVVFVSFLGWN